MMQKHVDKAQEALEEAIKRMAILEKKSCECAANGDSGAADANAKFAVALGHLQLAKGEATLGCVAMPEITPQFGGK